MNYLKTLPKMSLLLLFFPVAWYMQHFHVGEGIPLFLISAVGMLGTVSLISMGTSALAHYFGPVWGGLLSATFGNVTELLIALEAVARPELHEVVRASLTGSIMGNLLMVLGAAMFYGGLRYRTQTFSRTGANVNVGMLWVVVICLLVPTFVNLFWSTDPQLVKDLSAQPGMLEALVQRISLAAAVILLAIYVLSLIFSLKTHRFLLVPTDEEEEEEAPAWGKATAGVTLLGATVLVGFLADYFVDGINQMLNIQHVKISEIFVGVVLVAFVGNVTEGSVAIWAAGRNKMELAYQIAMGSCLQVALFVAPVLVMFSFWIGKPLTLAFNPFEMVALMAAVFISSASINDGESTWLEGAMFLSVYLFFAIVFWYHP